MMSKVFIQMDAICVGESRWRGSQTQHQESESSAREDKKARSEKHQFSWELDLVGVKQQGTRDLCIDSLLQ
jgi:hypothetical protein